LQLLYQIVRDRYSQAQEYQARLTAALSSWQLGSEELRRLCRYGLNFSNPQM
jgi:hypothetical protein